MSTTRSSSALAASPPHASTSASGSHVAMDEIAAALLQRKFYLAALELHQELLEGNNGVHSVGVLNAFFSDAGNYASLVRRVNEEEAKNKRDVLSGCVAAASPFAVDGLQPALAARDQRIALLEYKLRCADESLATMRRNGVQAEDGEGVSPRAAAPGGSHALTTSSSSSSYLSKWHGADEDGTPVSDHERRTLNALVRRYLLARGYKMAAVALSEEVHDQDLGPHVDDSALLAVPGGGPKRSGVHGGGASGGGGASSGGSSSSAPLMSLLAMHRTRIAPIQAAAVEEAADRARIDSEVEGLRGELRAVQEQLELAGDEVTANKERIAALETELRHATTMRGTGGGGAAAQPQQQQAGTATAVVVAAPQLSQGQASPFSPPAGSGGGGGKASTISMSHAPALLRVVADGLPILGRCIISRQKAALIPIIGAAAAAEASPENRRALLGVLLSLIKRPGAAERYLIRAQVGSLAARLGSNIAEHEVLPAVILLAKTGKTKERKALAAGLAGVLGAHVSDKRADGLLATLADLADSHHCLTRVGVVEGLAALTTSLSDRWAKALSGGTATVGAGSPVEAVALRQFEHVEEVMWRVLLGSGGGGPSDPVGERAELSAIAASEVSPRLPALFALAGTTLATEMERETAASSTAAATAAARERAAPASEESPLLLADALHLPSNNSAMPGGPNPLSAAISKALGPAVIADSTLTVVACVAQLQALRGRTPKSQASVTEMDAALRPLQHYERYGRPNPQSSSPLVSEVLAMPKYNKLAGPIMAWGCAPPRSTLAETCELLQAKISAAPRHQTSLGEIDAALEPLVRLLPPTAPLTTAAAVTAASSAPTTSSTGSLPHAWSTVPPSVAAAVGTLVVPPLMQWAQRLGILWSKTLPGILGLLRETLHAAPPVAGGGIGAAAAGKPVSGGVTRLQEWHLHRSELLLSVLAAAGPRIRAAMLEEGYSITVNLPATEQGAPASSVSDPLLSDLLRRPEYATLSAAITAVLGDATAAAAKDSTLSSCIAQLQAKGSSEAVDAALVPLLAFQRSPPAPTPAAGAAAATASSGAQTEFLYELFDFSTQAGVNSFPPELPLPAFTRGGVVMYPAGVNPATYTAQLPSPQKRAELVLAAVLRGVAAVRRRRNVAINAAALAPGQAVWQPVRDEWVALTWPAPRWITRTLFSGLLQLAASVPRASSVGRSIADAYSACLSSLSTAMGPGFATAIARPMFLRGLGLPLDLLQPPAAPAAAAAGSTPGGGLPGRAPSLMILAQILFSVPANPADMRRAAIAAASGALVPSAPGYVPVNFASAGPKGTDWPFVAPELTWLARDSPENPSVLNGKGGAPVVAHAITPPTAPGVSLEVAARLGGVWNAETLLPVLGSGLLACPALALREIISLLRTLLSLVAAGKNGWGAAQQQQLEDTVLRAGGGTYLVGSASGGAGGAAGGGSGSSSNNGSGSSAAAEALSVPPSAGSVTLQSILSEVIAPAAADMSSEATRLCALGLLRAVIPILTPAQVAGPFLSTVKKALKDVAPSVVRSASRALATVYSTGACTEVGVRDAVNEEITKLLARGPKAVIIEILRAFMRAVPNAAPSLRDGFILDRLLEVNARVTDAADAGAVAMRELCAQPQFAGVDPGDLRNAAAQAVRASRSAAILAAAPWEGAAVEDLEETAMSLCEAFRAFGSVLLSGDTKGMLREACATLLRPELGLLEGSYRDVMRATFASLYPADAPPPQVAAAFEDAGFEGGGHEGVHSKWGAGFVPEGVDAGLAADFAAAKEGGALLPAFSEEHFGDHASGGEAVTKKLMSGLSRFSKAAGSTMSGITTGFLSSGGGGGAGASTPSRPQPPPTHAERRNSGAGGMGGAAAAAAAASAAAVPTMSFASFSAGGGEGVGAAAHHEGGGGASTARRSSVDAGHAGASSEGGGGGGFLSAFMHGGGGGGAPAPAHAGGGKGGSSMWAGLGARIGGGGTK